MRTYILKAKFFRSNGLFYIQYSKGFTKDATKAARFPNHATAQAWADEVGTDYWETLESLTPVPLKGDE